MGRSEDVENLRALRVNVGLSAVIGVTVLPGQVASICKYVTGGSLEIGGQSLTWGAGYLFGTSEVVNMNSAGTFYLVATGATATCHVLQGLTSGQV